MKRNRPIRKLKKRLILGVKRLLREEILVLGDSHTAIFKHPTVARAFPKSFFNVINVGGATASGLANPNSKTQASQRFAEALADSPARRMIVMLGEVDTGFIIWYRAAKYGEPVESVMETAVTTYTAFLTDVRSRADQLLCVSTPLPTIPDGTAWGEVATARKEVTATQFERTSLTLRFNRLVREFCVANAIGFIDLDAASLGENGLVKPALMNPDPQDHHYQADAYAKILLKPLLETLNPIGA
ncbi:MAG: SGNH/GDSL hydrolase family protein [Verrucomicrobiota bacterium]